MMKGFENKGKWLGLALLAMGLVFAGCVTGGDSSSDEGALAAPDSQAIAGVPITVDPANLTMSIGEAGGWGATVFVDGHTVELANGSTSAGGCTGSGSNGDAQCWITVINRAEELFMYDTFINVTNCPECNSTVLFDNADLDSGAPIEDFINNGTSGASAPVAGAGYCVVESGANQTTLGKGNNLMGCETYATFKQSRTMAQVIHPDCGAESIMWDFGGKTDQYGFWASIESNWAHWNPMTNPPTGWDPNQYTFMVIVLDLANNLSAYGFRANWYNYGSPVRSNVLYGMDGETVVDNDVVVAEGQYFAVHVALEYPDAMEAVPHGDPYQFPAGGYDYSYAVAAFMRYDPQAVTLVPSAVTTPGGTPINGGEDTGVCRGANCGAGKESYGWYQIDTLISDGGYGWVTSAEYIHNDFKDYAQYAYYTTIGQNKFAFIRTDVAQDRGHQGIAKLRAPTGAPEPLYSTAPMSTIMVQQGVDAATDRPLRIYYFQANAGVAGYGSKFWIEPHGTWTFHQHGVTGTSYDGGPIGHDDDIDTDCPNNALEYPITGPGVSCDAGGHFQAWNAHICVQ